MKETVQIKVSGMTCDHCKATVEKALQSIDGVSLAEVNLEDGTVKVTYDSLKVDIDHFTESIDEAGYEFLGFA